MALFGRKKQTADAHGTGDAQEPGRLTVKTSNGETWEDPSEDLLFELCTDIEREHEEWFIVAVEGKDQDYMQMCRAADGRFLVERRSGSPETHLHGYTDNLRLAHEEFSRWAFGGVTETTGQRLDWQPGMA